jgi:DNA-binding PadR family transcriptional regulator
MSAETAELTAQPTPLGYALLTLVIAISRPTHGYEIVKAVRQRGGALGYSESQIYRELRTLAASGYLQQEPGELIATKRRIATYTRTRLGVEALMEWAETPVGSPRVDVSEVIPRIRAARLVSPRSVMRGLAPLREQLEDQLEELRVHERQAKRNGEWDDLMELEFDLERLLINVYEHWSERALSRLQTMATEQTNAEYPSPEEMQEFLRRTRQPEPRG